MAQDRLSIYTGRNTYLLGAAIYSDVGNLALDTGTLTFDNYHDADTSTSGGIGISVGFQDNKFLREQSDAFGSIAYSNTTGITYATIGAGEITVRDATAGFSLDALNRDPDNMQVITSQTSFAIEIPGINLKRWATQVKDSVNLIKAVTANVPQEIRNQGDQAVDLYRDAIFNGLSGVALRDFIASDFYALSLNRRNSWVEAKKAGTQTPAQTARLAYLIGVGEEVYFDETTKQMMIVTNCGTSGYGNTPCGVPLSQLSSISKDQVLGFINDSIEILKSAKNDVEYKGTLKAIIDCAMAWNIQGGESGFDYMEYARAAIPAGSQYDSYRAALDTTIALTVQLGRQTALIADLNNASDGTHINLGSDLLDIISKQQTGDETGLGDLQNLAVRVALEIQIPNGTSGDVWTTLKSLASGWGDTYVASLNMAEAISIAQLDARSAQGVKDFWNGEHTFLNAYELAQAVGYTSKKGINSPEEFLLDAAFETFNNIVALGGARAGASAITGGTGPTVGVNTTRVAGSIRKVNPTRGRQNCVNCVIATDATLAGNPMSALPGRPTNVNVLETYFNSRFGPASSRATIEQTMLQAGNGARGIVFGARGSQTGHVFNVVNQGGTIRFLDGQTGATAIIQGYSSMQLLRTN